MADFVEQGIQHLGWILPAWLFVLGSVIGSFLNVVIYRLPAGKSLSHPGSRCPVCGHAIRWYHNVPIVSWFLLRGRCHDCGTPISSRYPLVELVTALLFTGLAAVEIFPLAARDLQQVAGPQLSGTDVLVNYGYHLWLVCTLLCAALIEWDQNRVPRRLIWLAIAVGLIVPIWWPTLVRPRFILAIAPTVWPTAPRIDALATAVVGLAAGFAIGWLGQRIAGRGTGSSPGKSPDPGLPALLLAAAGAYLGWQGAVAVGVGATVVMFAARMLNRRPLPTAENATETAAAPPREWGWGACLLVGVLVWIAATQWNV